MYVQCNICDILILKKVSVVYLKFKFNYIKAANPPPFLAASLNVKIPSHETLGTVRDLAPEWKKHLCRPPVNLLYRISTF